MRSCHRSPNLAKQRVDELQNRRTSPPAPVATPKPTPTPAPTDELVFEYVGSDGEPLQPAPRSQPGSRQRGELLSAYDRDRFIQAGMQSSCRPRYWEICAQELTVSAFWKAVKDSEQPPLPQVGLELVASRPQSLPAQ